ncbi:MAG: hypothetical protein KTR31_01570 [Myxococcales bacterium]|nr:hypothetical protein [Myxococcales bacterium]
MSNRSNELLEQVGASEVFAREVEAHLDDHPLPVDEDAVQAAAARLQARLAQASAVPPSRFGGFVPGVGVGLLAAAVAATVLGVATRTQQVRLNPAEVEAMPMVAPAAVLEVGPLEVDTEGPLPVHLSEGAEVLTARADDVTVVLVRAGSAEVDGSQVDAGTWAVVGPGPDGVQAAVTFADGAAPPPEVTGMSPTADAVLQQIRWASLPDRTHHTLRRLLQEEP